MKKPKILILPVNIVSIPSLTAATLIKKGYDATCIDFLDSPILNYYTGTIHIPAIGSAFKHPGLFWQRLKLYYTILKYFLQADIIHWIHKIPAPISFWTFIIKLFPGKVHFVEFLGTDTRMPSVLRKMNPYYDYVYDHGYEYASEETDERAVYFSKMFNNIGAIPLLAPEMLMYNKAEYFPKSYLLFQRMNLSEVEVHYPAISNERIRIVHSPTKKITKGSVYVEKAIAQLKLKYPQIEYIEMTNQPRKVNLETVASCDIFVDQLIVGGYGMAATEAMSMGKPVCCYLLENLYEYGLPKTCPIVNTNPDNLMEQLEELILHPEKRHSIGKASREYVEKYHDADKVGEELIRIYHQEWKTTK